MVEERIGLRYARSIYGLAKEKGLLTQTLTDMQMMAETCKGSQELTAVLRSPIINGDAKHAVMTKLFGSRYTSPMSQMLVDILVRKGREQYLLAVAKGFVALYDEENKVLRGVLKTATPLSDATLAQIKASMETRTGEKFEMAVEIDPTLIGGFTLQVGDKLFDGSVSGSLRTMAQEFKKNTYIRHF